MITGKEDLLQTLIEVYLGEKGTYEFYSQAAIKVVNPEAKKVFNVLSAWEEKHMEFIQFLYQSIQDDRDMKSFKEFNIRVDAPITEAGIPVKGLEKKLERYIFIDDLGALIMALEIEGRAYNLYQRLSKNASDSNAKVVFKEMMEQELKHIGYLKRLRMRLAETS